MQEKEWLQVREEYFTDYRFHHEGYFEENPTHRVYDSYGVDADGNVVDLYLGIEDDQGNATGSGNDEYIQL